MAGYVMFTGSGAPGMVLGVVRGNDSVVRGYGETSKNNNVQPDKRSLVRLNSITKVFAGEVLAASVAAGTVRLTDPLADHAAGGTVPGFAGRTITLLDLATYSAALPREMGDPPEGVSPRAWPTRADRWAWLPRQVLPWSPGTGTSYSNVGFDLLADALETAVKAPYPELLARTVTRPLGMNDTTFTPDAGQCARLMTGSGVGGTFPCGDTTATDGSGGLYSTAEDMVMWLRHNMDEAAAPLVLAHAAYRQRATMPVAIGFDEAGPMTALGLGWIHLAADEHHPALLAKSGGGLGFMTYVVFAPGRGVGVFVAVNRLDLAGFKAVTEGAHAIINSLVQR